MRVFDRRTDARTPDALASGRRARRFLPVILPAVLLAGLLAVLVFAVSDDGATANLVGWALPLVRLLVHVTTLAAVAFLCVGTLLPTDGPEDLSAAAQRLGRRGSAVALAAVVVCFVFLLWTYFDVIGKSPLAGGDLSDLGTFLNELASGRAVLAQMGFLLVSALIARIARSITALRMALFLAVAGTTTLALGGHAASEDHHGPAMFAMTGHLAAASLWVGGLAGLCWLAMTSGDVLHAAVTKFSRLALICASVVGVSGVASAIVRVPEPGALPGSLYGLVLLLKVVMLGVLIGFGVRHRRRLLAADTFTRGSFAQLAAGELMIMGAAYGLAIALVGLDPPVSA